MKARDVAAAAVKLGFAAALKDAGFKKSALLWRRTRGDVVDVVQLQTSFDRFALNVGVSLGALDPILKRKRDAEPSEPACDVRERFGPVDDAVGDGPAFDRWWSSKAAPAALGADLVACFTSKIAPWLAVAGDVAALDAVLDAGLDAGLDDRARYALSDPLGGVHVALAVDDKVRAQKRLDACVADIIAKRKERNMANDPFGSGVLDDAKALAQRFSLRDATVGSS